MSNLLTFRNFMWALALGITIWLSLNAPEQNNVIQAKRQGGQAHAKQVQKSSINQSGEFAIAPRVDEVDVISNLFAVPVKEVIHFKPKPAVRQVKVKPVAPPLPFKYLGSVTEDGKQKLFMNLNDQLLTIQVGDKVGNRYQLTAIEKMGNRSTLKFLYLPMKLTQTMVVNNAN